MEIPNEVWTTLIIVVATAIAAYYTRRPYNEIKRDLSTIALKISEIIGYLNRSNPNHTGIEGLNLSSGKTAKPSSPITLTERGLEIAKEIKAQDIVDKYHNRVLIPEDADNLRIQEACFTFAFNDLSQVATDAENKAIREAVYQEAGNTSDILIIFGILLRDKTFEARGISIPKDNDSNLNQ